MSFHFGTASVKNVNKIPRKINPNEETDPDKIPLKLVKLVINIGVTLTYIFSHDISSNASSTDSVKTASIEPIFKRKIPKTKEAAIEGIL